MARDYKAIDWRVEDGLLWLVLDRPDHMNAFTVDMAEELVHAFERADLDDEVGVIIVTGAGRTFCAGMDLSAEGNVFGLNEEMRPTLSDLHDTPADPAMLHGVRDTGGRVALAIHACRKPVIAAINGAAVGVGITMTLAMDFRMMSEKAKVGFVFGRLGIVPEACSTWFLPRIVGLQRALEWVYTADLIDAPTALAAGLVRSVHAPQDLLKDAEAFARRLVRGRSPVATGLTRQMMMRNLALPHPFDAHCVESLAMFYTSIGDGAEGVAAFKEKREAQFTKSSSQFPQFYDEWINQEGATR